VAPPNLKGFAGDLVILGAIEFIGNAGLSMTFDALLVVHGTPTGDHVVDHLL